MRDARVGYPMEHYLMFLMPSFKIRLFNDLRFFSGNMQSVFRDFISFVFYAAHAVDCKVYYQCGTVLQGGLSAFDERVCSFTFRVMDVLIKLLFSMCVEASLLFMLKYCLQSIGLEGGTQNVSTVRNLLRTCMYSYKLLLDQMHLIMTMLVAGVIVGTLIVAQR